MRSRLRNNRTGTGSDSDSEVTDSQRGVRRKGNGNGGRSASENSIVRERPSSLLDADAAAAAMEGSASNSFLKDSGISDVVTNSPDENSAADVADSRIKFGAESRSNKAGER